MRELWGDFLPMEEMGNISSLGLAYIGDAVFELHIRLKICWQGKLTAS